MISEDIHDAGKLQIFKEVSTHLTEVLAKYAFASMQHVKLHDNISRPYVVCIDCHIRKSVLAVVGGRSPAKYLAYRK